MSDVSVDPRRAEVWLSTKVRVRRYLEMEAAQDKRGIADFIVHRFRERYITPLQNVTRGEENGFLIMAASCLLIEGFTAFREGWSNTKSKSERAFKKFFSSEEGFSTLRGFEQDFWVGIRCGILHQGETCKGWRLDFTHDESPLFDGDAKKINCTRFLAELNTSLDNYDTQLLNSSWEDIIWQNLRKKMEQTIKDCTA
jgi:hypothetical protein